MILDCMDIFKKEYEEKGDSLILDKYTLTPGLYLSVDYNTGEILDTVVVEYGYKSDYMYDKFIKKDYLSSLLEMNKYVGVKTIHSNNYMSFWIKTENLIPDAKTGLSKLNDEIIDKYYDALLTIDSKYKSKNDKIIYKSICDKIGQVNKDRLELCRAWIKSNLLKESNRLIKELSLTKKHIYTKVFFCTKDSDCIDLYENESNRYFYPKIFNNNQYCEIKDGKIYGLPNNNMGMNPKKPFLKQKGKKIEVPLLVTVEEAIMHKKLFDFFSCLTTGEDKRLNLYIGENGLEPINDANLRDTEFSGMYIRLAKEKNEAEIVDYSVISRYSPNLSVSYEEIIPHFKDSDRRKNYGDVETLGHLRALIDDIFFVKNLNSKMFADRNNIKMSDIKLKKEILLTRDAYIDWFYKGNRDKINFIFGESALRLILNNISNGYINTAIAQFNLRTAIINYLKGDRKTVNNVRDLYEEIILKLDNEEVPVCESDDEYYFALGQIVSYLLSQSNSSKRKMSEINSVMGCVNNAFLKKRVMAIFKKYNHAIYANNKVFKKMYSMIIAYNPSSNKVDREMLCAGYLFSNILFIKKEVEVKNEEDVINE